MSFPHDKPLTPEEARAFLEVHAEREARGPRPSDLAETLGLSPDEARSILAEARSRIASRPANRRRAWFGVGGVAAVLSLVILATGLLQKPAPALTTLATEARTTPPPTPLLQAAKIAPPAPLQMARVPVNVPDGFEISIRVSGAQTDAAGSPRLTGADYRSMPEADAARVRADLVEATLAMIDNALANPEAWMRAPELWVNLRVRDGAWTLVKVPIKPFTLPLEGNPPGRESLRQTLSALYGAGWPDVLRGQR